MTELNIFFMFAGVGYIVIRAIYQYGKSEGSRKGYNVGRKHAKRR